MHCTSLFFQTLMSVKMTLITVMRMHSALTQRGVSLAPATLAMQGMAGLNAQVNELTIFIVTIVEHQYHESPKNALVSKINVDAINIWRQSKLLFILQSVVNIIMMMYIAFIVLPGLILPVTLVSTGVLIVIIVLLCVAICVMYKLRRTATPVQASIPLSFYYYMRQKLYRYTRFQQCWHNSAWPEK